jgi:hypothetical protein
MTAFDEYFKKRDRKTSDVVTGKIAQRLDNGQYLCTKITDESEVIASKANPNDEFVTGSWVILSYLGASGLATGGGWVILTRAPQEQRGVSATVPLNDEEGGTSVTMSSFDPISVFQDEVVPGDLHIYGSGFEDPPTYDDPEITSLPVPDISSGEIVAHILATSLAALGWHDVTVAPGVVASEAINVMKKPVPNIIFACGHATLGGSTGAKIQKIGTDNIALSRGVVTGKIGSLAFGGRLDFLSDTEAYWTNLDFSTGDTNLIRFNPELNGAEAGTDIGLTAVKWSLQSMVKLGTLPSIGAARVLVPFTEPGHTGPIPNGLWAVNYATAAATQQTATDTNARVCHAFVIDDVGGFLYVFGDKSFKYNLTTLALITSATGMGLFTASMVAERTWSIGAGYGGLTGRFFLPNEANCYVVNTALAVTNTLATPAAIRNVVQFHDKIYSMSDDGHLYEWNTGTNTFTSKANLGDTGFNDLVTDGETGLWTFGGSSTIRIYSIDPTTWAFAGGLAVGFSAAPQLLLKKGHP